MKSADRTIIHGARVPVGVAWLVLALLGSVPWASAATPLATYRFNDTLAADQPGAPAVQAIDPLGLSGFETVEVFGQSRPGYRFNGNESPSSQQAGLVLATTGLASLTRYTVEMIFSFDQTAYYRRVLDVENRESDSGLYVNPDNQVELYYNDNTIAVGTTQLGTGFHHLLFVVDDGTVRVYVDGVRQFAVATTGMSLDNANNPQRLINLFVDNAASGGASDEYSDGRIALCRLFDAALTDVEAVQLFQEANGLPSLAVSLNDTALVTGETLGIRAVTASGPTQALVDLYVILQVPGDIFASVIGGGGLVLGAVPLASSLAPVAADVEVFAHTFTGDEPSGTYVVYAAITEPGTLNVLGVVQLATFSFAP